MFFLVALSSSVSTFLIQSERFDLALALMRAGQAYAALQGRDYVLPDDVKGLAVPVLAHRLILKEEELLRGETAERLVEKMVAQVPVPAPLD